LRRAATLGKMTVEALCTAVVTASNPAGGA
jgi:hypothetical protein